MFDERFTRALRNVETAKCLHLDLQQWCCSYLR